METGSSEERGGEGQAGGQSPEGEALTCVAYRVDHAGAFSVPGCSVRRCSDCGAETCLAPSSVAEMAKRPGSNVICHECFSRHLLAGLDSAVKPMTPQQAAEILASLAAPNN